MMVFEKLARAATLAPKLLNLPTVGIALDRSQVGMDLYEDFTQRHSRYFFVRRKTLGVALIKPFDYRSPVEYLNVVGGKNSAAYFSRKAARCEYRYREFDPNVYADQIFIINTSTDFRQGRPLDQPYREKIIQYPCNMHFRYFGIFLHEKLVAYQWMIYSGELALINRIMGHADHLRNGIMYLLITSYICSLYNNSSSVKVVMYDTLLGGREGLKMFKMRCGFKPYRVNWKLA